MSELGGEGRVARVADPRTPRQGTGANSKPVDASAQSSNKSSCIQAPALSLASKTLSINVVDTFAPSW